MSKLPSQEHAALDIIVVAGMSGAGKTVAIKALEDCGYYPLDHLPADMLSPVLASLREKGETKIAIGLDIWDPHFLQECGNAWANLASTHGAPRVLLLESTEEALVRRYGETRRRHPLTKDGMSLPDAIAAERAIMDVHSRGKHRVDTSEMNPNTLKAYVKNFLNLSTSHMDICIESFGFKHGAPSSCDLIFDARCLPNPYYDQSLRPLTGLDAPVRAFFSKHERAEKMARQIATFIEEWKPDYERDHRSYLAVGIGCTGGQHRSVYVSELARDILEQSGIHARCRHREQARWPGAHGSPSPKTHGH